MRMNDQAAAQATAQRVTGNGHHLDHELSLAELATDPVFAANGSLPALFEIGRADG